MAQILTPDGRLLLDRVSVSRAGEHKNAKGLLGRDGLAAGEGLLLSDPTGSIHMFFMRFAIDAVFLTKDLEVVKVVGRPEAVAGGACPAARSGSSSSAPARPHGSGSRSATGWCWTRPRSTTRPPERRDRRSHPGRMTRAAAAAVRIAGPRRQWSAGVPATRRLLDQCP